MYILGSRQNFGKDWTDIVATWCLGQPLSLPDEAAWEALGTLEQLWPEYLGSFLNRGIKGWTLIAEAVDTGLTLATCQKLKGFEGIQKRLNGGDQDVLSEVRFAAALVGLGYEPILDEPSNGHRPDALIVSGGKEICIDVIAPHLSDDMTETYAQLKKGAEGLLEKCFPSTTSFRLDIYCQASSIQESVDSVSSFLADHPQPTLNKIYNLPNVARIMFSLQGSSFVSTSSDQAVVPPEAPTPVLICSVANHMNNNVAINFSIVDTRLKRIMSDKRKQFSKSVINVLAVDLTHIPGGFQGWQSLVRRVLQPNMNRRFSGVLLYQWLWNGTARPLSEWHLEQHPNPYEELPASFVELFR